MASSALISHLTVTASPSGEAKKRLLHKEKIQVQQPLYG